MEDAADHAVTQLRHAARKILDREAERQQARILDLKPVVEDGQAQRGAALRVVSVNHRVDDRLADRYRRKAPTVRTTHGTNLGAVEDVFVHEGDRLLDGTDRKRADLGAIDDTALVSAVEAAGPESRRPGSDARGPCRRGALPPTVGTLRPW